MIFTCDNCEKEFERDVPQHVFCSAECHQAFRKNNAYKMLVCDFCGRVFVRRKKHVRDIHNFCSRECWHKFRSREFAEKKPKKCYVIEIEE